jgi:hypothetical protein
VPRQPHIPDELHDAVFTTRQAAKLGVSASMLRGRHFVCVHRGVWRLAETDLTFDLSVRAASLALPPGSAVSHVTALQWMGIDVGRPRPLHFSTRSTAQVTHDIVLHRRLGRLAPRDLRGIPVLGPDRSFVDSATLLGLRDLVRAGDALVRSGLSSIDRLLEYVMSSHLDGVVRAREAALLVRERVDSPRETDVRLLLVSAGLPEPHTNLDVFDDAGTWLARGDLVIPELRLIIEHDGWHHERSAEQRQKDHLRRERIEAAGWIVIVITTADFQHPTAIVARVYEALVRRGYAGPPPFLTAHWRRIARGL